jgi:U3 small nucleolar RNA-associated protein 22
MNYVDPVSSSGSLLEAFDALAKQLRSLDDIPLKISTVQPLGSGLTLYLFILYACVCFIFLYILLHLTFHSVPPFLMTAFRHTSVLPPAYPNLLGNKRLGWLLLLPNFTTTCIPSLQVMIQVTNFSSVIS